MSGATPDRDRDIAKSDIVQAAATALSSEGLHVLGDAERDITLAPKYIRDKEAAAIETRRENAFQGLNRKEPPEKPGLYNTVGLSLSGGGIRSASFNLGLLQCLVEKGLIRWVDFLSTVSGGGFIGTYFSTLLSRGGDRLKDKKLELLPTKGPGRSFTKDTFIRGGQYLKDPSTLTDRFLIGLILNAVVLLSLLVFLTALLAWLWRWLDYEPYLAAVRYALDLPDLALRHVTGLDLPHWFRLGDYYRDWSRPFAPFLTLLTLWLVLWAFAYLFRYSAQFEFRPRWRRRLVFWMGIFFLVGLAVLLATEDIDMRGFRKLFAFLGVADPDNLESLSPPRLRGHHFIGVLLAILVLLNLLPYFNPVRLLRSDSGPPGKIESGFLVASGTMLVLLVPFSLVFFFAREGISGYPRERSCHLVAMDLPDPGKLLQTIQAEAQEATGGDGNAAAKEASVAANGKNAPPPFVFGKFIHDRCFAGASLLNCRVRDNEISKVTQGWNDDDWPVPSAWTDADSDQLNVVLECHTLLEALTAKAKDDRGLQDLMHHVGLDAAQAAGPDTELQRLIHFLRDLDSVEWRDEMGPSWWWTRRYVKAVCSCYLADLLNANVLEEPQPIMATIRLLEDAEEKEEPADAGDLAELTDVALSRRVQRLREAIAFEKVLWPRTVLAAGRLADEERRRVNRLILEATYAPDSLVEQRTKAGSAICWGEDQWRRFCWWGVALVVFGISGILVNLNATSLHGYFRMKIHDAYVADQIDGELLRNLKTVDMGGPYHFLCATLNFFSEMPWRQTTDYSSGYTFLFSPLYCGSQPLGAKPSRPKRRRDGRREAADGRAAPRGYAPTDAYCGGELDVATATAISGAAFSPAMMRNPLLFYMFMLFNFRLGQWVPNPRRYAEFQKEDAQVRMGLRKIRDALRERDLVTLFRECFQGENGKRVFSRKEIERALRHVAGGNDAGLTGDERLALAVKEIRNILQGSDMVRLFQQRCARYCRTESCAAEVEIALGAIRFQNELLAPEIVDALVRRLRGQQIDAQQVKQALQRLAGEETDKADSVTESIRKEFADPALVEQLCQRVRAKGQVCTADILKQGLAALFLGANGEGVVHRIRAELREPAKRNPPFANWPVMAKTYVSVWGIHYLAAMWIRKQFKDERGKPLFSWTQVCHALRELERGHRRFNILQLLKDFLLTFFGMKQPGDWDYCFVTDGGHNDNLGISPLIFRRCRLIIISDATRDGNYDFTDFMKAYRRYRMRTNLPFCRLEDFADLARQEPIELARLKPNLVSEQTEHDRAAGDKNSLQGSFRSTKTRAPKIVLDQSERHFVLSKLAYNNPEDKRACKTAAEERDKYAVVVYIKSSMTGDEAADLQQYRIQHPEFPHDPTTDQFFTENQVESYRQLGHHIGSELCRTIARGRDILKERRQSDDFFEDEYSVEELVEMLEFGYFAEHQPETERFPNFRVLRDALLARAEKPENSEAWIERYAALLDDRNIVITDREKLTHDLVLTFLECEERCQDQKAAEAARAWQARIESIVCSRCDEEWPAQIEKALRAGDSPYEQDPESRSPKWRKELVRDLADRIKEMPKERTEFLEQILQMCREADAEEDTGAPTSAAGATAGTLAGKMSGGNEASQ